MKFNERLIELRKREGLSQEDLGYKLNVTRQTVSKWELGITTPEMEKLVEISKLFNVTVDELIKEDSTDYNNYNNYNTYESNFNSEVDGVFTGNENSNAGIKEPKKIKKGWIIAIRLSGTAGMSVRLYLESQSQNALGNFSTKRSVWALP